MEISDLCCMYLSFGLPDVVFKLLLILCEIFLLAGFVGVSSSGMAHKYPGRVGDSPLPGCGLYAGKGIG